MTTLCQAMAHCTTDLGLAHGTAGRLALAAMIYTNKSAAEEEEEEE